MKVKCLLLVLAASLSACEESPQPLKPPRPALVMTVGDTSDLSTMVLVGEVRPRYESSQGFRIDGKIIERKVDLGTQVKKGQVLVRLDAVDTHLNAAAAMADVRAAEANYALAAAELERQRQLFEKKFISASALDMREAELKTSSARLAQVKARANISGNQALYTNLIADRDGVVTMVQAEPGQVIQAGEALVKIANLKEIEVLIAVPESRLAQVKVNMPVTVKLWAAPQKSYAGTVREVSPAANSDTRAFNAKIGIKAPDEAVKLGMTAGVRFDHQAGDRSPELLIPSSALTQMDGKKIVWVIDAENKAQPREVMTDGYSEVGILVRAGLQVGERIAIAGVHTLIKDQVVRPVDEATP